MIKLKPDISDDERELIVNQLQSLTYESDNIFIVDVIKIDRTLSEYMLIIDILIFVISLISLTLMFFMIMITISANIRDNMFEYGVLRAMGMNLK